MDELLKPCDLLEPSLRPLCRGENPQVPLEAVNANRATGFGGRIEPLAPIPARAVDGPSILIRGWNFAAALTRWTLAGMPRRTQAEIDERLAICQACPHLHNNHCVKCGCACVEQNRLINKLALTTEKCPEGKWE